MPPLIKNAMCYLLNELVTLCIEMYVPIPSPAGDPLIKNPPLLYFSI